MNIFRNFTRFLSFFILPVLLLLLVACGGDATSTSSPSTTAPATTAAATTVKSAATTAPASAQTSAAAASATTASSASRAATTAPASASGGLTMKEAYTAAEPQIKAWQGDQYLFSIFNSLDSGIGIDMAGRSAEWNFQAISPKVKKRATWLVKAPQGGKATVTKTGEEELSADDLNGSSPLPPVSSLIDSSQLMNTAKQNGGDKSDSPVGFFLRQPIKEGDPLAVDLVFYKGNDAVRLRIDMQSGKVVQNDKG